MRRAYIDNNATTPVLPPVLEAMQPYFGEQFGNASSIHHHGQQTRAAVEQARESVAELLGARPPEIVFTSGGTEADNLALFGLLGPGDHLITSQVEHHAVLNAAKRLEGLGCEVTYLPVDGKGLIDLDLLRRSIRPNTRLISIIFANNETGVIQPAAEIGRIAAEADLYFHTDAVQAAGKVPVDVKDIACDLLSISGHKIHAPQGVGALFVRKGTLLQPMLYAGATSVPAAPAPRTSPASWAWARRRNSRVPASTTAASSAFASCGTAWKPPFWRKSIRSASTGRERLAFPTPATSSSSASKARPW